MGSSVERTLVGDRYVLGELLGRGGMADVHRGTDTVLDRAVAIKLLRRLTDDDADRSRFEAEARTLARLNHAGVVGVLDAGDTGERPYLVLELVDGTNLAECCTGAALHLSRVVAVGTQVADALAHAHAAGVVHRDVKPSNILLGSDGRVALTDFGIARLLGDSAGHTRTGTTIGSPAYLAPEQVRGLEVTPATDVYALGLVLIEMLTGRRAYPQTPTEAALARLTAPPELPDRLPEGWVGLLRHMTELDPEARPTAAEVAVELHRLALEQDPAEVTQATPAASGEGWPPPASYGAARGATTRSGSSRSPSTARVLSGQTGPRTRLAAAIAATVVAAVATLLVALDGGGEPATGGDVPADVPPSLQQPLGELHDAIEGGEG
jgi:serine/threonine protein kinase